MVALDLLAEQPGLLAPLARAYEREWPDWYLAGEASAEKDLADRSQRDALPLGLVAHQDGQPIGACALTAEAGPIATTFAPWLGGLWVDGGWRRRGIGSGLVARAVREAGRLGYDTLYTLTVSAEGLMRRGGWRELERVDLEGQDWLILSKDTADAH